MAGRPLQEHTDNQQTFNGIPKANNTGTFRHTSPGKIERIGTGEKHRARTSISVEPFAHHRNACDHITDMQSEEVDELQSPLKGNQRSGAFCLVYSCCIDEYFRVISWTTDNGACCELSSKDRRVAGTQTSCSCRQECKEEHSQRGEKTK